MIEDSNNYFKASGLRLWYLAPLSTIFQLYRGVRSNGGVNQRKSPICR